MTALAGLVAMRLTHELAGPLGAIATGVDLLGDSPGDADVRGLIADGTESALATLRLHRFVLAPPAGEAPANARALLAAWLATRDATTLDWQIEGIPDAPRLALLFGLAMCAAEALPRGGVIAIADGAVTATGTRAGLDVDIAAALRGGEVANPRAALAGVITAAARDLGGAFDVAAADGTLRLGYHGSALPR